MVGVEEKARIIIQRELGRSVVLHDDGSQPGMYDLRVGDRERPEMAIECVGAVDPTYTETWNVGPARGPLRFDVAGSWNVVLKPEARVKDVKERLEGILRSCEIRGFTGFCPVDWRLKWSDEVLYSVLVELGIESIHRYSLSGEGKVYLGLTGSGGVVDTEGTAVPGWISSFLRDSARADVLTKLRKSCAPQCQVFVPVDPKGAPWSVESYLATETNNLPTEAPDLPFPVSGVWITYGVNGICWEVSGWRSFDARV